MNRFVHNTAAMCFAAVLVSACTSKPYVTSQPQVATTAEAAPGESHLTNIRQLTHGGENAEAYFSADGKHLIFQSTRDGRTCDQEFTMRTDGTHLRRISTGTGKTTCGWYYEDDKRILFGSSHAVDSACTPRPDPSKGYVWRLDPYDIYTAKPDGSDLRRLTNYGVYTAEGTVAPDGETLVFTSLKDGDLDLYSMRMDGSGLKRLTNTPGYDGGAVWSPDGKHIVYRAWHPADSASLADYESLLAQRLVRPTRMEIWVMNADGSDQHQITSLGGANFAPAYTPDGKRIIFSSNYKNPRSYNFDLYLINPDGTGLEQVTFDPEFDGFPMFSPDGKQLVWASSRRTGITHEINIYLAQWR